MIISPFLVKFILRTTHLDDNIAQDNHQLASGMNLWQILKEYSIIGHVVFLIEISV
jgi:hypothetical protein